MTEQGQQPADSGIIYECIIGLWMRKNLKRLIQKDINFGGLSSSSIMDWTGKNFLKKK